MLRAPNLLLLLLCAGALHPRAALGATPEEPPPARPTPQEEPSAEPSAPKPSHDFDLFGDTSERADALSSPDLSKAIARRHHALKAHQILGLSTLALTAATVLVGQFNYDRLYTSGASGNDSLQLTHRILAYSTVGAFATTAGFALFAPKPVERSDPGFSTIDFHKLAVAGASAGMLTQLALGFVAAQAAQAGNGHLSSNMAGAHQLVGWTTLGLLSAAGISLLF